MSQVRRSSFVVRVTQSSRGQVSGVIDPSRGPANTPPASVRRGGRRREPKEGAFVRPMRFFQHREIAAKRFGLFKEMLPKVRRVAILSDSLTGDQLEEVEAANRSAGLKLQSMELRNPPYDFESVFRAVMRSGAEALFVLESSFIFRERTQIAQRGLRNWLPTSFAFREYVEAGGLISYGVNFLDMWRRAAEYTDKILKGAKPGDLPLEQATKFELVINLKTAKALGLTIPQSLLQRADQVIE